LRLTSAGHKLNGNAQENSTKLAKYPMEDRNWVLQKFLLIVHFFFYVKNMLL